MHALGSRALGFTQELFKPDGDKDEEAKFEFGLDFTLEGLEMLMEAG